MGMKKGIYFTGDAFFSTLLLLIGVILITQFSFTEVSTKQMGFVSNDVLNAMGGIKVSELNNSWIAYEIANGGITEPNNTVLEQIGAYWAAGEQGKARNLSRLMVENLDSEQYNLQILVEGEHIYGNNASEDMSNMVVSRQMVTGIEKGAPIQGSSSTAYIRRIKDKKTYSYAYFGGLTGQGNITVRMEKIPEDVNATRISRMLLEVDAKDDFELYINGDKCGSLYNPASGGMAPDTWNITACKSSLNTGYNNFSLLFRGSLNNSYVAGGYVRVEYVTNELQLNQSYRTKKKFLPAVKGMINLYDSFYVPGSLQGMKMKLHYYANTSAYNNTNLSLYMTMGNTPIYTDSAVEGEETVVFTDNNFSGVIDYASLSQETVPIRLGVGNLSFESTNATGNSDVVLITDLSGSMRWRVGYSDTTYGEIRNCSDPSLYDDDTRRISLAKCLDKDFIGTVLNSSGNRMALVGFDTSTIYESLTSDADYLKSQVDDYSDSPSGGTCIACALNRAYNILDSESSDKRDKYIIVMTDGIASSCAGCGSWFWGWCLSCDSQGTAVSSYYSDCGGGSGDCTGSYCQGAMDNSEFSACRANDDLNTTIHSIGFGPVETCSNAITTLQNMANCGDGDYYASSNASELQEIYDDLADQVISIKYYQQLIHLEGELIASQLYGDSYLELNYTPVVEEPKQNEISIRKQEPLTDCEALVDISDDLRVVDAHVTSYSGPHWTSYVGLDSEEVFNLTSYGSNYGSLGDPFIVQVPGLQPGNNTIKIETADNPTNTTNCSVDNSLIYTAMISSSIERTGVFESAKGCVWDVEYAYGTNHNLTIPLGAVSNCTYNSTCHTPGCSYNNRDDTYAVAAYRILSQADFDNDGKVDINFGDEDIELVVSTVSGVPYMWGPSIVEVRIWQ